MKYVEDLVSKFPLVDVKRGIPPICRQILYGGACCKECLDCWKEEMEMVSFEHPAMANPCEILEKVKEESDKVNHPSHYTTGKIECLDYIEDKLTPDEFKGYCKGNIIKYITRERHKNGLEDIKKAQFYLNKLVEVEEE